MASRLRELTTDRPAMITSATTRSSQVRIAYRLDRRSRAR